jgi:hypothetical protein
VLPSVAPQLLKQRKENASGDPRSLRHRRETDLDPESLTRWSLLVAWSRFEHKADDKYSHHRPASAVSGDSEFGSTLASISVSNMPKNPPPPICTKCSKPMQYLLRKNIGGRRFQCPDCEGCDLMRSSNVAKIPTGESRPLK